MASPTRPIARNRGILSRPPVRHESHSRVRRVSDAERPSTIPPRPLPRGADLGPLEWWLDAHMNVASNLLCLEQSVRNAKGGHGGLARAYLGPLGDLRDALYELYCDCGDPRLLALQTAGSPLAAYVSGLYALCDEILETLATASSARGGGEPSSPASDIETRCAAFTVASADLPDRAAAGFAAVMGEPVNPADPLRAVGARFDDVVRAAGVVLVQGH